METYEILTILQIPGKDPEILQRSYLNVEYETDDRNSFVYTRTRKIKVPPNVEHYSQEIIARRRLNAKV